jgi:hypothetical protein
MNDEDVVVFFRSLTPARRKEYDALAERDRRFGEAVESQEDAAKRKPPEGSS